PVAGRLAAQLDVRRYYEGVEPQMRALCTAYVVAAFRELGWSMSRGDAVTVDGLMSDLDILDHHQRLVGPLFEILVEDGLATRGAPEYVLTCTPETADVDEMWRRLAAEQSACHAEVMLLGRCGRRLAAVLTGEIDPMEVVFPERSGTADHLYESA